MKVVMLNKDNTVVDIVDEVRPVKKSRSGVTILCKAADAQGYVGSDGNTVYAKMGTQFQPSYYDIASMIAVDDENIPAVIVPLAYKYDAENGFTVNMDDYPDSNIGLTNRVSDTEDMLLELSEYIFSGE